MEQEIRKAILDGNLYDYVADNYYSMSKEQLKELILNLDWVATRNLRCAEKDFYKELDQELADRDFYEE